MVTLGSETDHLQPGLADPDGPPPGDIVVPVQLMPLKPVATPLPYTFGGGVEVCQHLLARRSYGCAGKGHGFGG